MVFTRCATALAFVLTATSAQALLVQDLYDLDPTQQAWYLGGVYDTLLADVTDGGAQSQCMEATGFERFMQEMSDFIVQLPTDPASPERTTFDKLSVPGLAMMLVDQYCPPEAPKR